MPRRDCEPAELVWVSLCVWVCALGEYTRWIENNLQKACDGD